MQEGDEEGGGQAQGKPRPTLTPAVHRHLTQKTQVPALPWLALSPRVCGLSAKDGGKRTSRPESGPAQACATPTGSQLVTVLKEDHTYGPSPQIWIDTKRNRTIALMDTAATANFVRSSQLTPQEQQNLRPYSRIVRQADAHSRLEIHGQTIINICINGHNMDVPVLVAPELDASLILGQPWLQQQQAVLDYTTWSVHYGFRPRKRAFWPPPEFFFFQNAIELEL